VTQQATHVSKRATSQLLLQARTSCQLLLLGAVLQLTAVKVTNTESAVCASCSLLSVLSERADFALTTLQEQATARQCMST
jgi:hypothetical protein